jgi:hypothetical protein
MMNRLLKASALGLLVTPFALARADLVLVGPVTIGGTGLGTVNTVLTIQSQGSATTEQGCVTRSGSSDVTGNFTYTSASNSTATGCVAGTNTNVLTGTSQTQTRTLAEAGITSGSNFAVLFNGSEPGGSANSISLDGMVVSFYNAATGALLFSAPTDLSSYSFLTTQSGTGNTGFEFTLNSTEAAQLQSQIASLTTSGIRVGLGAAAGATLAATGGNETFFIFNSGAATVVPEPSTVVLTASGMLGLVGFVRRRRRR